ncbi:hypothetical protein JL720_5813 [Aureococcus anophagefferens]|nr:hypothetical protein JL720_5813 [Aureococcus anophagefferens]
MADDQDPSCSPDSGSVNNNGDAQQVAPPTMDVIGDPNLGLTMLVLLLMGLMNYSMRDPCTC